ncbi:MAG: hypothetical protein QM791_17015 [Ferruginibacter sp.]
MKKSLVAFSLLCITGNVFAQAVSNESPVTSSADAAVTKPKIVASPEMKVFPNPARNKITVDVKGFEPGMISVKIVDTKGKMLRQDNRLLTSGSEEVPMFIALEPCTCYVVVEQKNRLAKRKLVIY